jgi:hypothetical protein
VVSGQYRHPKPFAKNWQLAAVSLQAIPQLNYQGAIMHEHGSARQALAQMIHNNIFFLRPKIR